jgi:hypothetical protein
MCEFDEVWRAERMVPFSTNKHDLYTAVSAMVMMGWGPQPDERPRDTPSAWPDLSRIHTLPQNAERSPSCPAVLMEFKLADPTVPWSPPPEWGTSWMKGVRGMHDTASPAGWFNVYRKRGRDQHTVSHVVGGDYVVTPLVATTTSSKASDVPCAIVAKPLSVDFNCTRRRSSGSPTNSAHF